MSKVVETLKQIKHKLIPDWARKKYYKYLVHKEYFKAMNLPECEYEDYLVKRYEEFMNRHDYTKGKKMSFDNPQTFSQKSQWIKLYDQDPRKSKYSDKYQVRNHIKEKIGEDYLISLISIDGKDSFKNANEIDFDKLPNRFVLKCNNGSHMNIIVKDKNALSKKDIYKIKKQLNKWLETKYCFYVSLETQYLGIEPRIIIEEFMEFNGITRDYKFMCFNGKCEYFWINEDVVNDDKTTCTTFNRDLTIADFNMNLGHRNNISNYSLPSNINKMIEIADKLSEDFIFVRVDLYNNNGKIYFGELTFNSAAGYDVPYPEKYDKIVGDLIIINQQVRDNDKRYQN